MPDTPATVAADPTAPAVSRILDDAAHHTHLGPIRALVRAAYGSTDPDNYAAAVTPLHTIAWGMAIVAAARIVAPDQVGAYDPEWDAGRYSAEVGAAHQALDDWATRNPQHLAEVFRAAADRVRVEEAA